MPAQRPDSGAGEAQELFTRADGLAGKGQLQEAESCFRQADEQGHATAAAVVGVFAESRGDVDSALDAYRRADERGDGLGALRLGLWLARQDDWDGANQAFARAQERGQPELSFDADALIGHGREPATSPPQPRPAFANPVLIGAVTVLVVIVGVFLAYSANSGLPFVPTRELKVDIGSGSDVVTGNDVREGGFRIGLVSDMRPVRLPGGQVGAELLLKLDQAHAHVPVDSTATILPRSVLGTKFVQLNIGHSSQLFADGGTLPLTQTSVPVQIEDVYSTFDAPTRKAIQQDLTGYGDTLTARGSALNDTFANLPALLAHLQPVAHYLADPATGLTRFLTSLNAFMSAVAPVAQTNARLFADAATTFAAISSDPNALERTIAESPPTLDVSTDSLRAQMPFLTDLATLGRALTPATASLRDALPAINPALEAGISVLPRTPALNARLSGLLAAVRELAQAPGTNVGLNALTATVQTLNPLVRFLGPYQTVCDDWTYFWTFFSDHVSEQTNFGQAQRVLLNFADANQPDNVGSIPASQPAGTGGGPEALHNPVYGAAIDSHGLADCETGQRGYVLNLNHGDPLHRPLDTDPHTPGNQGPTFAGRSRVPAGETFGHSGF